MNSAQQVAVAIGGIIHEVAAANDDELARLKALLESRNDENRKLASDVVRATTAALVWEGRYDSVVAENRLLNEEIFDLEDDLDALESPAAKKRLANLIVHVALVAFGAGVAAVWFTYVV